MGLFKKVKEILFDEEEYTEQIKITPEMRNETAPVKEEKKEIKEVPEKTIAPISEPIKEEFKSEKEVFKNENFPFLDFDEEEFEKEKPQVVKEEKTIIKPSRYNNVLEFERKKRVEKRSDYGRYEKTEIVETTERRKFKPSPIISPVYGILDKDYTKDDIQNIEDDKVDIQKVRDKAFGEVKKEDTEPHFYDQEETVTISKPIETAEKVRTIDELLEDTSDVVVDIDSDLENELEEVEHVIEENKKRDEDKEEVKTKEIPRVDNEDDTLEGDLFDLIDSMYDSKEGE